MQAICKISRTWRPSSVCQISSPCYLQDIVLYRFVNVKSEMLEIFLVHKRILDKTGIGWFVSGEDVLGSSRDSFPKSNCSFHLLTSRPVSCMFVAGDFSCFSLVRTFNSAIFSPFKLSWSSSWLIASLQPSQEWILSITAPSFTIDAAIDALNYKAANSPLIWLSTWWAEMAFNMKVGFLSARLSRCAS